MNEDMEKADELKSEILICQKKILECRNEIKNIKNKYEPILKKEKALIQIPKYEERYAESCRWTIESLVFKNETFEEYFERIGKNIVRLCERSLFS